MWARIAAVALVLGCAAAPASAATYQLELFVGPADNPFGDGVPDWFGQFTAAPPPPESYFETAHVVVAGVVYSELLTFGPFFQYPLGPANPPTLDGFVQSGPIPELPATVRSISFSPSSNSVTKQFWYLADCGLEGPGPVACTETPAGDGGQSGGFTVTEIAPVPLPAAALLLPVGIGALVALRRRHEPGVRGA
jgi:hypothetical protein